MYLLFFFFFPAEYFQSHLLAFSSNLDEHNPDVAEWRLDVSRVIKNALIQVQIPLSLCPSGPPIPFPAHFMGTHCFYSVNVWQDKWWSAGAAWPRWDWQTMILTMMVMNEKSRGRKRVKMCFRSCWLLQLMNKDSCSEEEMSRCGSRLISKLGIDALQPVCRRRFQLKHTTSYAYFIYSHIVTRMEIILHFEKTIASLCLFFCCSGVNKTQVIKINPALQSSVNTSVLEFVPDVILLSQP